MEERNTEIDKDFSDIDEKNKYKDYIIVGILYILVIILSILFIIGIKNQKDVIKNNIKNDNEENSYNTNETFDKDNSSSFKDEINLDDNTSLNENNEQTDSNDSNLNENKEEINNDNSEFYDEYNILNQM